MYEADKIFLDYVALHFLTSDAPDNYTPIKIVDDGNCFSRTVIFILFHTQHKHSEVRTHMVYEGVQNMELYLNNTYLAKGATHSYHRGTLFNHCAMYSDNYNPDSNFDVTQIYIQELLDICKDGGFMGIWQLFQIANVIQNPVSSVYPNVVMYISGKI